MISDTSFAAMVAPIPRLQAAATKGKPTRAAHPARVEPVKRWRIACAYADNEKVASIAAREGVSGPLVIRVAQEYRLPLRGRGNKPANFGT